MKATKYVYESFGLHGGHYMQTWFLISEPRPMLISGHGGSIAVLVGEQCERALQSLKPVEGEVEIPELVVLAAESMLAASATLDSFRSVLTALLPPPPGDRRFADGSTTMLTSAYLDLPAQTSVVVESGCNYRASDPWDPRGWTYYCRPANPRNDDHAHTRYEIAEEILEIIP